MSLPVDRVKFEEGRAGYRAGFNLADLMDNVNQTKDRREAAARAEQISGAKLDWDAVEAQENAEFSFALGFGQGALDDLRKAAAMPRL